MTRTRAAGEPPATPEARPAESGISTRSASRGGTPQASAVSQRNEASPRARTRGRAPEDAEACSSTRPTGGAARGSPRARATAGRTRATPASPGKATSYLYPRSVGKAEAKVEEEDEGSRPQAIKEEGDGDGDGDQGGEGTRHQAHGRRALCAETPDAGGEEPSAGPSVGDDGGSSRDGDPLPSKPLRASGCVPSSPPPSATDADSAAAAAALEACGDPTQASAGKTAKQLAAEDELLARARAERALRKAARGQPFSEPKGRPTHRDALMKEMQWLAKEFQRERAWKLKQAKRWAQNAQRSGKDLEARVVLREKEEERAVVARAAWIAREVMSFWGKARRVVLFRTRAREEAAKKETTDRQLEFLLGQTQRYSTMLAERLGGGAGVPTDATPDAAPDVPPDAVAVPEPRDERLGSPQPRPQLEAMVVDASSSDESEGSPEAPASWAPTDPAPSLVSVLHAEEDAEEWAAEEGEEEDDDEATLEEEEAAAAAEGRDARVEEAEELAGLGDDIDVPIEVILARYGVPARDSPDAVAASAAAPGDGLEGRRAALHARGAASDSSGDPRDGARVESPAPLGDDSPLATLAGEEDAEDYVADEEDEDDEATLEEEEAAAAAEGRDARVEEAEELAGLGDDIDVPIEVILARYGVLPQGPSEPLTELRGTPTADPAAARGATPPPSSDEENEDPEPGSPPPPPQQREPGRGSLAAEGFGTVAAAAAEDDADDYVADEEDEDDEATLEEEEAATAAEGRDAQAEGAQELAGLEGDAELSVEELLASMPGYRRLGEEDQGMGESEGGAGRARSPTATPEPMGPSSVEPEAEPEAGRRDGAAPGPTPSPMDADVADVADEEADSTKGAGEASSGVASGEATRTASHAQPPRSRQLVEPPFLLRAELREYQRVGLDWLATLNARRLNGILADEMGLGKTIQTIALLAHLACAQGDWGPHLVVVPTSVMLNWEMEFKRFCPAFKLLTYYGSVKERAKKREGWSKPNAFHVCITSYTLILQDARVFRRKRWKYLILDEAHMIKNWRSARWQTLLNFHAKRRLLVTGTPLQNDLMELWSLMHFLMPAVFASHDQFKDWFSQPLTGVVESGDGVRRGGRGAGVRGPADTPAGDAALADAASFEGGAASLTSARDRAVVQRLHAVLRPFLLRRLKKDVEKNLPPKHEHVLYCELSRRQRTLYDEFMATASTRAALESGGTVGVVNALMQLRKVCNHPDLFAPRPIESSFQSDAILVRVPQDCFLGADRTGAGGLGDASGLLGKIYDVASAPAGSAVGEWRQDEREDGRGSAGGDAPAAAAAASASASTGARGPSPPTPAPGRPRPADRPRDRSLMSAARLSPLPYALSCVSDATLPAHAAQAIVELSAGPAADARPPPVPEPAALIFRRPGWVLGGSPAPNAALPDPAEAELDAWLGRRPSPEAQRAVAAALASTRAEAAASRRAREAAVLARSGDRAAALARPRACAPDLTRCVLVPGTPGGGGWWGLDGPRALSEYRRVQLVGRDDGEASGDEGDRADGAGRGGAVAEAAAGTEAPVGPRAKPDARSKDGAVPKGGARPGRRGDDVPAPPVPTGPPRYRSDDPAREAARQAALRRLEGGPRDPLPYLPSMLRGLVTPEAALAERACRIVLRFPAFVEPAAAKAPELVSRGAASATALEVALSAASLGTLDLSPAGATGAGATGAAASGSGASGDGASGGAVGEAGGAGGATVPDPPPVAATAPRRLPPPPPTDPFEAVLPSTPALASSLLALSTARATAFPDPRLIQYDAGKLQALAGLLRELAAGDHRALIFTQMSKMLDTLEAFLNLERVPYVRLDGATKPEQRAVLTQRFNRDARIKAFILSTRSGGVGLNLTGADTVIFYDADWNPAMDAQAQDRCHRIGQTRPVHIYRLVSRHTIEENILTKSDQKRHLDYLAIQSGGFTTAALAGLTAEGAEAGGYDGAAAATTLGPGPGPTAAPGPGGLSAAMLLAEEDEEGEADALAAEREARDEADEFAPGDEAGDAGPGHARATSEEAPSDDGDEGGVSAEEGGARPSGVAADEAPPPAAARPAGSSAHPSREPSREPEPDALDLAMGEGGDVGAVLARVDAQLRPVERYAVRWLEIEDPEAAAAAAAVAAAQAEAAAAEERGDLDLARLDAEEAAREAEADDEDAGGAAPVSGWDAAAAAEAYEAGLRAAEEAERERERLAAERHEREQERLARLIEKAEVEAARRAEQAARLADARAAAAASPAAAARAARAPASARRRTRRARPRALPVPWDPSEDVVLVAALRAAPSYLSPFEVAHAALASGAAAASAVGAEEKGRLGALRTAPECARRFLDLARGLGGWGGPVAGRPPGGPLDRLVAALSASGEAAVAAARVADRLGGAEGGERLLEALRAALDRAQTPGTASAEPLSDHEALASADRALAAVDSCALLDRLRARCGGGAARALVSRAAAAAAAAGAVARRGRRVGELAAEQRQARAAAGAGSVDGPSPSRVPGAALRAAPADPPGGPPGLATLPTAPSPAPSSSPSSPDLRLALPATRGPASAPASPPRAPKRPRSGRGLTPDRAGPGGGGEGSPAPLPSQPARKARGPSGRPAGAAGPTVDGRPPTPPLAAATAAAPPLGGWGAGGDPSPAQAALLVQLQVHATLQQAALQQATLQQAGLRPDRAPAGAAAALAQQQQQLLQLLQAQQRIQLLQHLQQQGAAPPGCLPGLGTFGPAGFAPLGPLAPFGAHAPAPPNGAMAPQLLPAGSFAPGVNPAILAALQAAVAGGGQALPPAALPAPQPPVVGGPGAPPRPPDPEGAAPR